MDTEGKKEVVMGFYKTAFEQKDPEGAVKLYVGDYYRQHNPNCGDGKEAFIAYAKMRGGNNPNRQILYKRIFVDGDFVILHIHHLFSPTDENYKETPNGFAAVDIFRLEKGKIVEHWDVLQTVPDKFVHNNTMF
jgi:predicted SnoaL-like aldol condensation-catalyzing enzyme